MDGQFIIQEYEVIRETPKYWFAQMCNIPNDMCMTFQIKKDNPDYFRSPDAVVQSFIQKQERKIDIAEKDIVEAHFQVNKIKMDLEK
jgi:hypothetical protein